MSILFDLSIPAPISEQSTLPLVNGTTEWAILNDISSIVFDRAQATGLIKKLFSPPLVFCFFCLFLCFPFALSNSVGIFFLKKIGTTGSLINLQRLNINYICSTDSSMWLLANSYILSKPIFLIYPFLHGCTFF